jgi:hypothetical protein
MPLVVIFGSRGGVGLMTQRTLLVLAGMAAGFLAGTPYAVLDLPASSMTMRGWPRTSRESAAEIPAGGFT